MQHPTHEQRDRAFYARLAAHAVRLIHPETSVAEQRQRVRSLLSLYDDTPQQ
jgi:hypothetical protein